MGSARQRRTAVCRAGVDFGSQPMCCPRGIVNLSGRSMLVVSVAGQHRRVRQLAAANDYAPQPAAEAACPVSRFTSTSVSKLAPERGAARHSLSVLDDAVISIPGDRVISAFVTAKNGWLEN
jgi:hypothetical protein